MIVIILVILAAICNATMDIINHKYAWSIFDKHNYVFNSQFWDPRSSWRNKYKYGDHTLGPKFFLSTGILVFLTDGWHLLKSTMIVCLMTAIVLGPTLPSICLFKYQILNIGLWIIILGTIWNITFSLFYNKILRQ